MNSPVPGSKVPAPRFCALDEFVRRLEEEANRAVEQEIPFSVVLAQLGQATDADFAKLRRFISTGLRTIDFAGVLGDRIYVLGLPYTPKKGAQVVAGRFWTALVDFAPLVGIATGPEDAKTARELVGAAAANALARRVA